MTYQLYSSVASTALCILFVLILGIRKLFHYSGIRSPINSLLNSLVKNFIPISLIHVWPNRFYLFFILLSAFFTSLLTQVTSSLTTSTFSVLGSLSFSSFTSFSKYSIHLFNTASKLTITLPFSSFKIFTCCKSFSFCLSA